MRKAWLVSAFTIVLGLLAASGWLIFNPTTAFAADGTARCGGATTVRCEAAATRCVCEDFVGCTSYFSDGSSSTTKCSNGDDEMLLY